MESTASNSMRRGDRCSDTVTYLRSYEETPTDAPCTICQIGPRVNRFGSKARRSGTKKTLTTGCSGGRRPGSTIEHRERLNAVKLMLKRRCLAPTPTTIRIKSESESMACVTALERTACDRRLEPSTVSSADDRCCSVRIQGCVEPKKTDTADKLSCWPPGRQAPPFMDNRPTWPRACGSCDIARIGHANIRSIHLAGPRLRVPRVTILPPHKV